MDMYDLYVQQLKEYNLSLSCQQIGEGIIDVLKDTYTHKIKPKKNVHQFQEFLNNNNIPCVILTSSELKMSKTKPEIYKYTADSL